MNIVAKSTAVRISPRKAQLVASVIRNTKATKALSTLMQTRKRGAAILSKTLKSAIANAKNNANVPEEGLTVEKVEITVGPALKRFHPSSRGRVHPYKKRSSNITIVLTDGKEAKTS